MNPRTRWTVMLLIGGFVAAPAQAALYKNAAIGLSLFGFQFSGQRNLFGDGITINANAFYNQRNFNFGLADLTLTGTMNLSADITTRGLPALKFNANSGGGSSPLTYTFNINNGIQDLTATGNILINANTSINALGFYDQQVQISNRGAYATDGFGVVDSGTLDFDVGPIDLHGNIFADALAALTEPFFAASGTENPFAKFSGKATKALEAQKTVESLRSRINAGEVLSDDDVATLINNTVIAAVLGGKPDTMVFDNLLSPEGLLGTKQSTLARSLTVENVPEPAGLALVALALPLLRRRNCPAA